MNVAVATQGSTLIHTSVVVASLDADEPQHLACDQVLAAGTIGSTVSGQSTAPLHRAPAVDQRSAVSSRQGSNSSKSSTVWALGNSISNALRYL